MKTNKIIFALFMLSSLSACNSFRGLNFENNETGNETPPSSEKVTYEPYDELFHKLIFADGTYILEDHVVGANKTLIRNYVYSYGYLKEYEAVCTFCGEHCIVYEEHEHTYNKGYKYDENEHWQVTSCSEHSQIESIHESHHFAESPYVSANNNKLEECVDCGYMRERIEYYEYAERHLLSGSQSEMIYGETPVVKGGCLVCNKTHYVINGYSYSDIAGTLKANEDYVKFLHNGDSCKYVFEIPEKITGKLYLLCVIDRSTINSSASCGYFNIEDDDTCINIDLDGSSVTCENHEPYYDAGLTFNTGDLSDEFYAYYGNVSLKAGTHYLKLTRNTSYCPWIKEFHFIAD